MAVSLSNNFSLCYTAFPNLSFSPSASTTHSKTRQQLKIPVSIKLHLNRTQLLLTKNPRIFGLNMSSTSPFRSTNCRRSFTSFLTHQGSTFQTKEDEYLLNGLKISESETDSRRTLSLKSLINFYKKAILDGDEEAVSEFEAMIGIIENDNNKLVQKLSAISVEMKSGKEKYVSLQADFDNFRKRTEKERLTIRSDAQGDVIESLLPMVDSFEKAKQQIRPETEKEKKIDTSYQGIYKQLVEILRRLSVAVVPTLGKQFDPSVHEAVAREESQVFKEGIVSQELRRGFLFGDRLVRSAMVKVSTGPPMEEKPNAETGKSTAQPTAAAGPYDK